jgi:hypothetical protein
MKLWHYFILFCVVVGTGFGVFVMHHAGATPEDVPVAVHLAPSTDVTPAAQAPPVAAPAPAAPLTGRDIVTRSIHTGYDQCLPGRADFVVAPTLHGSALGWYTYYGVDTTDVDAEGGCAAALLGQARG